MAGSEVGEAAMKLARPIRYTIDGAAQALGLSRRSMWRRVHEWGMTVLGDHDDRGPGKPVYLVAAEVEAAAESGAEGVRLAKAQKLRGSGRTQGAK